MLVRRSYTIVRPLNGLSVSRTGSGSLPIRKCVITATADRSLIYGRFGRGCLVAEPAQHCSVQPALGTPSQHTSVAIFSADTYVSLLPVLYEAHACSGKAPWVHALSPGDCPGRGFSRKGN